MTPTAPDAADPPPPARTPPRVSTGIAGLDQVLGGGLTGARVYLLEGDPGTGKTTFGLSFARAGVVLGERVLYLTLSETEEELRDVLASHGWHADGIDIVELVGDPGVAAEHEQTILVPSDMELGESIDAIISHVERVDPARVVVDSLSEMRLLAHDPLRYRRRILAIKHYFARRGCTVLLLDDKTDAASGLQLHSLVHGVMSLYRDTERFGGERRRLQVIKMRGLRYEGGFHDLMLDTGRLQVFPRLVAADHAAPHDQHPVSSGSVPLDEMLGGGLVPGTSTMLLGPAGVGKSTTAAMVVHAALARGERAHYYLFDEGVATWCLRSKLLGMDMAPALAAGTLRLQAIDPAELAAGEFAHRVVQGVLEDRARVVVIDSLTAYLLSMPGQTHLLLHMHELLGFLRHTGVVTLLTVGEHGLIGELHSEFDLSYLSDTVLLYRYFEAGGEVRSALTAVKTRTTANQRSIRELRVSAEHGVQVGAELAGFDGIFNGMLVYRGGTAMLGEGDP